MLTTLFKGVEVLGQKEPLLLERKNIKLTREEWNREEDTVPIEKYNILKESRKQERREFSQILDKVERVEPTFGKAYYRIELDEIELTRLKRKLVE
jgi:hypothetical protein